jgi:hypothetical protein
MIIRELYRQYRQLIPALVLAIASVATIISAISGTVVINDETYDFALDAKHYGAFLMSAITVAAFFFWRQYYKYSLLLACILAALGLINFNAATMTAGIGIGPVTLALSPLLWLVGLLTYLLNKEKINSWFLDLLRPSEARLAEIQREETEQFKERFSRKPSEELMQIVAANSLVPTALMAARQLLQERETKDK